MITIRLRFPAGRYHATPWVRHVNEGAAEWPPSPYRLLRALYDVWQRKCRELPADDVRATLEALAAAPPTFHFSPMVASHTRAYLSANQLDPTDKNLVFDPFVVLERPDPCFISWSAAKLADGPLYALNRLLRNLNYLGRSESWVEADLWDQPVEAPFESSAAETPIAGAELHEVACLVPPAEYKGKQTWIEALTFSTSDLLKQKASSPPLLCKLKFSVPQAAIRVDPPHKPERHRPLVQAAVVSLDSTVLPLATACIELAEQVRTRLMGAHKKQMEGDETKVSPLFSGKTRDGDKRLDHGHVYILPLTNFDDPRKANRIDRVLIVSLKRPFEPEELNAVRGVRSLWQRDGRPGVECVVTWQGNLVGHEFHRSTTVQSVTPFVSPRHWRKGRDRDEFLRSEVARECRNHGIAAELLNVEEIATGIPGTSFHAIEYRRNRKDDPVRPGHALRLTFATEVTTPFAIGYGAHFGLGQFRPA